MSKMSSALDETADFKLKKGIAKEFNEGIVELIAKLQSKFPKDDEIVRVRELVVLAFSSDEFIIVIEAGALIFKYRGLVDRLKKGEKPAAMIKEVKELETAKNSNYGSLVAHILSLSFTAFENSKEAERTELYAKIMSLIVLYAKYLKLEKVGKI